jgi:hypothetical protein
MKKFALLILAVLVAGMFVNDLSHAEVNNDEKMKPTYQPFGIYFQSDTNNPDPVRDSLPWAEYDSDKGFTFYKVETIDGESPPPPYGGVKRCRIALDDDDKPIPLDPSDESYTDEIRKCINVLRPDSYVSGDIKQKYVSVKVFYDGIDIPEGEMIGTGRVFPKDETYEKKSIEYITSGLRGYDVKPGDIMLLDPSLQYEKWTLKNGITSLHERLAWNPDTRPDLSVYFPYVYANCRVRYTSLRKGFLELLPNEHKIIYRGEESEFHRWSRNLCEMHDGHVAMGLYTLGEILGCNVHSWNYETRKSSKDWTHIDYYYINLMDEDDSFRRITYEFKKDTAILHRPAYYDKEIKLDFTPYIGEDVINPYFEPLQMMVPVLSLLDTMEFDYYYRDTNNSVLIDLNHDW